MCDTCISILGKNARSHGKNYCILAKSIYCNICSVYGHSPTVCSKSELRKFRATEGALLEEPIRYDILNNDKRLVFLSDSEKAFSAMLIANKIVPMACQEKGRLDERDYHENKKRLVDFLKGINKKLVLISIPWTKPEDQLLKELIAEYEDDWKQIAVRMERRTQDNCKARLILLNSRKLKAIKN